MTRWMIWIRGFRMPRLLQEQKTQALERSRPQGVKVWLPSLPRVRKAQALEHMRPQGAMCSSVDNFQEFGKTCTQRQRSIPTFPCRGMQKVGKIPIPTNRIGNIHIGKIPVFASQKVGKIPTFGWFYVGKNRKNSGFSSKNLLSSSAATAAIYTLLKIKSSRSTKIFERIEAHCRRSVWRYSAGGGFQPTTGEVIIAPARRNTLQEQSVEMRRPRRFPSARGRRVARREKRRNVAPALANTPLSLFFSTESGVPSFFALPRRGTSEQFAVENCIDICSIAASSREEQIIKSFSEVIS